MLGLKQMISEIKFEYCSLHYLNQWLSNDKRFVETLAGQSNDSKLEILKKAAVFYKVARNLPETGDTKKGMRRYQPVLDIIDKVTHPTKESEVINVVNGAQKAISDSYHKGKVLSLTTKFLWLKVRHPILIYDSRTKTAIEAETGNYEDFCIKWKEAYERNLKGIERACAKLYKMSNYTTNPMIATEDYIKKISEEQWFMDRVFDIYLWHNPTGID
ncbi:MAG TPA: hypothetical protein VMW40_02900 [Candidatus Bathyarchaeia archaeon]|nr:hypothetical protein [Candidatus Bathyarchaeia archaeon]